MTGVERWERSTSPYFGFLRDHGFAHDPALGHDEWYGTAAVYRSAVSAVIVTRSVEFGRVEVQLARLVDGALPPPDVFFDASAPLNQTLLDNVVEARAPDRLAEAREAQGLKPREVEQQLALWAEILETVAPDFLRGETTVFDEAKEVVAKRVTDHPQQITVWLPDSATTADEMRAAEEARRGAPPSVDVVTRRYAPPP